MSNISFWNFWNDLPNTKPNVFLEILERSFWISRKFLISKWKELNFVLKYIFFFGNFSLIFKLFQDDYFHFLFNKAIFCRFPFQVLKSVSGFFLTIFSIFYDLKITKRSYWKQNGLSKRKTIILKKIKSKTMSVSITIGQKSFYNKYRWGPINSFSLNIQCTWITVIVQWSQTYYNILILLFVL